MPRIHTHFARRPVRAIQQRAEHVQVYDDEEERRTRGMRVADQPAPLHFTHEALDRIEGRGFPRLVVHGQENAAHDLHRQHHQRHHAEVVPGVEILRRVVAVSWLSMIARTGSRLSSQSSSRPRPRALVVLESITPSRFASQAPLRNRWPPAPWGAPSSATAARPVLRELRCRISPPNAASRTGRSPRPWARCRTGICRLIRSASQRRRLLRYLSALALSSSLAPTKKGLKLLWISVEMYASACSRRVRPSGPSRPSFGDWVAIQSSTAMFSVTISPTVEHQRRHVTLGIDGGEVGAGLGHLALEIDALQFEVEAGLEQRDVGRETAGAG